MILESYNSPDRTLTLAIEKSGDGEVCVGFTQSSWHTHPSLLVGQYGPTEDAALAAFTQGILASELVIAVVRQGDEITSIFVTATPGAEHDDLVAGETCELRYWNGQPWPG